MMCRCVELLLLLPVGCFNDEVGAVASCYVALVVVVARSSFLKKARFELRTPFSFGKHKRMPKISLTKTLVNCVSRGQEG